jgi:hypothetical protein
MRLKRSELFLALAIVYPPVAVIKQRSSNFLSLGSEARISIGASELFGGWLFKTVTLVLSFTLICPAAMPANAVNMKSEIAEIVRGWRLQSM